MYISFDEMSKTDQWNHRLTMDCTVPPNGNFKLIRDDFLYISYIYTYTHSWFNCHTHIEYPNLLTPISSPCASLIY